MLICGIFSHLKKIGRKKKMRRRILVGTLLVFLILGAIPIYSIERQDFPQIKALFDFYHYTPEGDWGMWFEDNYPGELTASYLTGPLTYEELANYDIFLTYLSWIPDLGPRPTASEVEALEQYVQNGGGVLLMGDDPYWGMWTNEYCNILSEPYNISFNDDQLLDPTDYDITVTRPEDDYERHIVFHNMAEHPVTAGVNEFWVHGTCSLIIDNPDAVVVVAGDDDTYSDRYPGYPKGSYPPAVVALEHGLGHILFAGDVSGLKHDVYDNRTFIWNILMWLAEPVSENEGPVTSHTLVTPDPTDCALTAALTATVDDSTQGNSNIQTAEYFIDTVGTNGTGTPMAAQDGGFDSPVENVTAVIDVTGLSSGMHTIYVHGKDAAGNWGAFDSYMFTVIHDCTGPVTSITSIKPKPPGCPQFLKLKAAVDDSTQGNSNIQTAEYFIDTVGTNGTGTPMAAQDGGFDSPVEKINTVIDVTGLLSGLHTIYVHGKDAAGNWGSLQSTSFNIYCLNATETPSGMINKQIRPLAQHKILKAEDLAALAQDLLSKAQAQGLNTVECEELIDKAEEFLVKAQEHFREGNYIAANTNALEAIEIFEKVIKFLKNLLG
jgi:hypothetical protein